MLHSAVHMGSAGQLRMAPDYATRSCSLLPCGLLRRSRPSWLQGTSPLMPTLACHACTRLAWASPCKLLSRSDSRWLQGTWAALASHAWSPPAQLLVKAIAGQLQQHNLKLVSHAYANIGPNKLAAILGMTPDAAVQGELCWWLLLCPAVLGLAASQGRGGFDQC